MLLNARVPLGGPGSSPSSLEAASKSTFIEKLLLSSISALILLSLVPVKTFQCYRIA
jgi:hypothetical protein